MFVSHILQYYGKWILQFTEFWWMCATMWVLYVDYSRSVVGHMCYVAEVFVQGNMQVMWNVCVPVFQSHYWFQSSYKYIHWHSCLICTWSNWHMWHIYDIWGAYLLAHIGSNVVNKSCRLFLLMCTVMCCLCVDHSMNAVGQTYVMQQTYLFRGMCQ